MLVLPQLRRAIFVSFELVAFCPVKSCLFRTSSMFQLRDDMPFLLICSCTIAGCLVAC
jgi:hypothetical protein